MANSCHCYAQGRRSRTAPPRGERKVACAYAAGLWAAYHFVELYPLFEGRLGSLALLEESLLVDLERLLHGSHLLVPQ